MNKRVIGIVLAIIIGVAGFLWITKPAEDSKDSGVAASTNIKGTASTGVVLVEYGDYECPACAAYHSILKNIVETYKDKISFQFRNYPLESIHQNARAGSRAAEAAALQGKFWEMHDTLYENQNAWKSANNPLSIYSEYAKQVGVADIPKFESDYKSSQVNSIINADLKEGQKFDIVSTPTFILDGKKIDNPRDQADFNKIIDEAIAAKQQ